MTDEDGRKTASGLPREPLYTAADVPDTFTAVDAVTGAPRWFDVPVGDQPSEVLVTPNARTAYLSIRGEDKIGIFSLAGARPRKVGEVVVGDQPDTLQLTPDRRTLVVATRGTFTLPGGPAARVDLVDTRDLRSTPVWIAGATTTGHQWLSLDGRWTFVAIESAAGASPQPGVAVIDHRPEDVVAPRRDLLVARKPPAHPPAPRSLVCPANRSARPASADYPRPYG